jgi:hypothetical protein
VSLFLSFVVSHVCIGGWIFGDKYAARGLPFAILSKPNTVHYCFDGVQWVLKSLVWQD